MVFAREEEKRENQGLTSESFMVLRESDSNAARYEGASRGKAPQASNKFFSTVQI